MGGNRRRNTRLTWSVYTHTKSAFLHCTTHTRTQHITVSADSSFDRTEITPIHPLPHSHVELMGVHTTSIGALVPTIKSEPADSSAEAPPVMPPSPSSEKEQDSDKDILCPICMQIIKDAFLTACGHSFCYMCIVTHLQNKSDCPCCSHFLTTNHIYPNFLLNKVYFLII